MASPSRLPLLMRCSVALARNLNDLHQDKADSRRAPLCSLKLSTRANLGHVEPRALVGRVSNKICSPHALGSVAAIILTLTHWQKSN